ncbi:ELMO CED12 domain containing protein [Trichuris trichiura]|uniref:ELMO CED12 domain containing protein n=1 Tax=Trichuris trichiura TaxID=36087 RepID=A0A077YXW2_TRITR|nr:ELMO CED12 domain containing protein [Trichuris trichiura]
MSLALLSLQWFAGWAVSLLQYAFNCLQWVVDQMMERLTGQSSLERILRRRQPEHQRVAQVERFLRSCDIAASLPSSPGDAEVLANELCEFGRISDPEVKRRLQEALLKISAYVKLISDVEMIRRISFDRHNGDHRQELFRLYASLKPGEACQLVDNRWQDIGFQGHDPSTDFRGMGILGLKQLLFLCKHYPMWSARMYSFSVHPSFGYPFAIVGINMTSLLCDLLKEGHLKSYFYSLKARELTMEQFHVAYCECFHRFDRRWKTCKPPDIMHFGSVRNQLKLEIVGQLRKGNFAPYLHSHIMKRE